MRAHCSPQGRWERNSDGSSDYFRNTLLKLTEPIQHDVDLCGCLRLLNRFEHQEAFTIGSNIEEQCCSARQEWPAVGLCYINVSQRLSRPTQLPNLRDGGERSRCEGNDPLIAPTCAAGHHS